MFDNLTRHVAARSSAGTPPRSSEGAGCSGRANLENLYRRERDGLLRYLSRQVGHDLAPDIVQEVFLRASSSPQIRHLQNPGGFLHRIARNILIDRARRRKCRIVTLPLIEGIDAPSAAEQEEAFAARDLRAALENALSDLPERTRIIFTMHRFEEMAYRDIQRELDISLAAVEYHMMRALAHVRATLARFGQA